jgi:hypothetical protein
MPEKAQNAANDSRQLSGQIQSVEKLSEMEQAKTPKDLLL